jgi:hypothetical protein
VDPNRNGSSGSGSVLGIRIRIQDSQNGVQKGIKICDFKLKRAFRYHFAEGLMVLTLAGSP